MATPGYFLSFSKGSGGQSDRRRSSQSPYRAGSGPFGFSKHGSLTRPRKFQRLSRLASSFSCEEMILSRSKAPKLSIEILFQKRSFPPVHTIQVRSEEHTS